MDSGNSPHPLAGKIDEIDAIVPSPEKRAEVLWALIRAQENVTTWDTICFCVNALGLLSAEYLWLRDGAQRLSVAVYHAHYNFPHLIDASSGIRPDRFRDSGRSEAVSGHNERQAVRESQGDSGGIIRSGYESQRGFTDT